MNEQPKEHSNQQLKLDLNLMLHRSRKLCHQIEELPAGECQTKMSETAASLSMFLQTELQKMFGKDWYIEITD